MNATKAFLSISTRQLDENRERYLLIRRKIKGLGYEITNDWLKKSKSTISEKDFKQVEQSILDSDCIIFEISVPSTSIGYQISYAIENKKPCLILFYKKNIGEGIYAENHPLNYVDKNYISVKTYNEENIEQILSEFINDFLNTREKTRFNFVLPRRLNNYLETRSAQLEISKTEYLKRLIEQDISKT